jgi:very-short-patch-repair endonuclease
MCGGEFRWPDNYSERQWRAQRYCGQACAGRAKTAATRKRSKPLPCPVCGTEFWAKRGGPRHCGAEGCAEGYKKLVGPKLSKRMKADYAAGRRKKSPGISPRETTLWEHLRGHGWVWRLRWIEDEWEFELDFSLPDLKLNVEVDGAEHGWARRRALDKARDAELRSRGWTIVRISNHEVDQDVETVAARILSIASAGVR